MCCRRARAQGAVIPRRTARMARSPQGRAGPPHQFPLGRDRAPARNLDGYLIAYLNLDEVIRIIRRRMSRSRCSCSASSSPTRRPKPSSTCACAPCASSRRWRSAASMMRSGRSSAGSRSCCKSDRRAMGRQSPSEIREVKEKFGKKTPLGKRRTDFAEAPEIGRSRAGNDRKEPVTVVCSEKGWIRAIRGHLEDARPWPTRTAIKANSSSRPKRPTASCCSPHRGSSSPSMPASSPGGRGHGEPVRLMADLEARDPIVALFVHRRGPQAAGRLKRRLRLHRRGGRMPGHHAQGQAGAECEDCRLKRRSAPSCPTMPIMPRVIGDNRKLADLRASANCPTWPRARRAALQKYKDGGLSDATAFG